jgi:hypothetical protein
MLPPVIHGLVDYTFAPKDLAEARLGLGHIEYTTVATYLLRFLEEPNNERYRLIPHGSPRMARVIRIFELAPELNQYIELRGEELFFAEKLTSAQINEIVSEVARLWWSEPKH